MSKALKRINLTLKKSGWQNLASHSVVKRWLPLILMLAIGAVCYMVLAERLGFYNDDWYLLYAGTSQGGEKFLDIFSIDRPFRGVFMSWIFSLFGVNGWLYSLSAFVMRCLAALGWWWILRRVWPQERQVAYLAALFSLIYPGFLDQPNAFDFQSHQWSFALAVLSIACTVGAMQASRRWVQIILVVFSIITQVSAYLLMEYYIGLEGLRFLLVVYLAWQAKSSEQSGASRSGWLWPALINWLPAVLAASGFLYWQTQILAVGREATDVNQMVAGLSESPALRLVWVGVDMLRDLLNVIVIAWAEPVYRLAFALRLKLLLLEFALAGIAGIFAWLGLRLTPILQPVVSTRKERFSPTVAMFLIGILSAAAALFPVHLGNRQVVFESFSRFSLTPSLGAVLVLGSAWRALGKWPPKTWLAVVMVCLAALVHTSNTLMHAETWDVVRNFWWQVSWRIPQIEPGTVLAVDYAGKGIAEDYFVWGPANLIYYPEPDPFVPDRLILTGITLNGSDVVHVLTQAEAAAAESTGVDNNPNGEGTLPLLEPQVLTRRTILSEKDYSNLLVLSMSTEFSCVQVLDSAALELSDQSNPAIMAMAPYSQIGQIMLPDEMQTPPQAIFGAEPPHDWCYYYQKASLARQRGDWEEILRLGDLVKQHDLRPYDWIEWMPFLQAYAYFGDDDSMDNLAWVVRANPYYRLQACRLAVTDPWNMAAQSPDGHQLLVEVLCEPAESE